MRDMGAFREDSGPAIEGDPEMVDAQGPEAIYRELIQTPFFRDAESSCRGPFGKYFIKLCRSRERRFLLRNDARMARRFSPYGFCPPLIGFYEDKDTSCLIYRRVAGPSLSDAIIITKPMVAWVSSMLGRVNEAFAQEGICQLDPSPNNIILDKASSRAWYIDYELCAPFGTEAEIMDGFNLDTEEERLVLYRAFRTAGCRYKPAHIEDYGDEFNRYMNDKIVRDMEKRRHVNGFLTHSVLRFWRYWLRVQRRLERPA
jgi:tRNA A-37 threonylcarbamoyl transferase component Bud32